MSKTVQQIFATNPTTVVADTDLYYLVQTPYTPGSDAAISGASLKAAFGAGGTINPGLINQLAYYAAAGSTLSGLTTANDGVLITSGTGVPSISSTLPSAVQLNITSLGTVTAGIWNATTIGPTFGGTGLATYTLGDIVYASAANTLARLSGNTTSTKNFLSQTGTGVISAAPVWSTISASDIGSGQALTRTNDTNVTLTLGGTPTTALLAATSLTLGWTGTLSGTRGGTGVNNGASTITIAGNLNFAGAFTTSGAFAVTQTYTNTTNVTFPTSGTLATTSQIPTGAALTKTDDTNVTLTLGGSPTTALVNAASLTLGWTGTLSGTRGGTGVNNGSSTITIGGNVTFSGAFTFTGTITANTSVTFPTSGTLATTTQVANPNLIAQGRLTLTTGVAVTTADVTGASAVTIYFTPYKGSQIGLYDGSTKWDLVTFSEINIAVPSTTNTMYDVFCFNSSGTATLEVLAWTNDTTRATALVLQDGIYVKSGATTRRYLGSFRTTGTSGQTEDSLVKRYLWNYYNRCLRPMKAVDATASWNYSTATYRQANANTANQLDMVIGVSEDQVIAHATHKGVSSGATQRAVGTGIGIDSTTVNSATTYINQLVTNAFAMIIVADYVGFPGIGRHFLAWLEIGAGGDTQTFVGNNGSTLIDGITGIIRG